MFLKILEGGNCQVDPPLVAERCAFTHRSSFFTWLMHQNLWRGSVWCLSAGLQNENLNSECSQFYEFTREVSY